MDVPANVRRGWVTTDLLAPRGHAAYGINLAGQLVRAVLGQAGWTVTTVRRRPLPNVRAMRWCGRALLVAFDGGQVGRLSASTGQLIRLRQVASIPLQLTCSEPWAYAATAVCRLDEPEA